MSPTATGPAPSGVAPISKKAQVTPDDKTTNDPRDSNIHRAIAQHPYGGAANLRDVFTNQVSWSRFFTLSNSPGALC
ncbi:uncharacterized protein UHO2_00250 [Ustilago hordei]|uniref:uncharacterized protein n=1 Tax=Ustilago hordei TaxID=120017 RepID=UPI001A4316ED|nr:uncharacterized protein UHO2_00250 [Ustilago hordei]SYW81746.1 uncharacterized protein UHO2_00250 [Ustilago hordei]